MHEQALGDWRFEPRPRVAVLADVRLYREGLAGALESVRDVEVVGAAPMHDEGLALLTATRPDVVLLDEAGAHKGPFVQALLRAAPNIKVIAVGLSDEFQALLCAEAGASGYVPCEATITDLVSTIIQVVHGEFPCSPRVAALLASRVSSLAFGRPAFPLASALTGRERQILALIDAGLSNKEIAARLCIAVSTVKNHVHRILEKTSASRRAQAAARLRTTFPALQAADAEP